MALYNYSFFVSNAFWFLWQLIHHKFLGAADIAGGDGFRLGKAFNSYLRRFIRTFCRFVLSPLCLFHLYPLLIPSFRSLCSHISSLCFRPVPCISGTLLHILPLRLSHSSGSPCIVPLLSGFSLLPWSLPLSLL